jgi:hypothetical protein
MIPWPGVTGFSGSQRLHYQKPRRSVVMNWTYGMAGAFLADHHNLMAEEHVKN